MKKIISVLLCAAMLFGLIVPVFAAEPIVSEKPFENSEFFDFGEYSIHYRVFEAQEPKGNIMMLHGFAESTLDFEPLAALLVDGGYTCVLVDLPDFGYSTRETKDTDKLPREDIIYALMTYLSDDPWYLASHSMGGYIALAVAQKYPDSVRNLLLYGTSGNSGVSDARTSIMSNDFFAKVVGSIMECLGKSKLIVRLLLRAAIQDKDYVNAYDVDAFIAPFKIKGTGAGVVYNFSVIPTTDYEAVKNMAPILFMNGDKDKVIKDSDRAELRAALPEGSLDYIVEGGGHMFVENLAEETARVTLDFIARNTIYEDTAIN